MPNWVTLVTVNGRKHIKVKTKAAVCAHAGASSIWCFLAWLWAQVQEIVRAFVLSILSLYVSGLYPCAPSSRWSRTATSRLR